MGMGMRYSTLAGMCKYAKAKRQSNPFLVESFQRLS